MADLAAAKRVLVTGASGFLGGHLARFLRDRGTTVVAVGRNPARMSALREIGCDLLSHDISSPFPVSAAKQIDAVVHCAALSAPFGRARDFERMNTLGTANVLAFAKSCGADRFVHISTPSVYFDFRDQLDLAENTPLPKPINHYARTKRQAEALVLEHAPQRSIILRPRGIYGPGDTALLPRLLRSARARPLPLMRNGAARIDLTYVGDVVDAIVAALAASPRATGQIFNISGGQVLPVQEIVERSCQMAGFIPKWRKTPLPVALTVARCAELICRGLPNTPEPFVTRYGVGLFAYQQSLNITKARDVLGWTPQTDFSQGLQHVFAGNK